jgi:hypothetical protein
VSASIAEVLRGSDVNEYRADPSLFWLIRLMDLGFIIPASLTTAIGLLMCARWAIRAGYAFAALLKLLVGAVASMGAAMTIRQDPSANAVLLAVMALVALILGALYVGLLRSAATSLQNANSRVEASRRRGVEESLWM